MAEMYPQQTPYGVTQQSPYVMTQQTPYVVTQQTPYFVTQQTPYVVTQQPCQNVNVNPFNSMNNEWHADICGCCNDVSQCCYAYFCFCCFVGSLATSIGESQCSCCCVPYALAMYRMKVRSILNIRGDTCNDHCVTFFCPFCASLQMRNELTCRGLH